MTQVIVVKRGPRRAVIAAGIRGRKGDTGSDAAWGGIVGTLADQLDLLAALNGKATSAQGTKADTAVQPGALAPVATSGSYTDLINKPVLGTAAATAATDYATAAQGATSDTAVQPAALTAALADKVDKLTGYGLSQEDYTTAEQSKLAGIATGATANADTDSLAEGVTNKWFTDARVRAALATGLSFADSTVIAATDSFLQIAGKLAARLALAFDRANHTGEQPISTVTGLQVDLDGRATTAALTSGLAGKVDIDGVKVLSDENYTSAEKSKLAGLESSRFKGLYASLGALQTAHPTAGAGDYADVDAGVGSDTFRHVWDVDDAEWKISGSGAPLTSAEVKTLYEANADTNAFTDTEKTKLGTVASNATANPDTDSLAEGATNKWFTEAGVRATLLTGLSLATSTAVAASDNLLIAVGKLAARLALKEQTLAAGTNVTIDRTDPDNPIINASITGGGGGDVVGPVSAVDNGVALFDGITGDLIKDGGVLGTAAFSATGDFAPAAHVGAGGAAHANAVAAGAAGFMTGADKTKLDGVATDANLYIHPNHTGDVTSTADGAQVIANDVVSNAKLADVATSTIKGRATAATGDPEDLTAAQVRTILNVEDGANSYAHPNHTGDVTSTGDGAQVITDNAVTNTKLADVATATIKGRVTAATGDPEDLSAAQVRTLINVADGATANDTDANLLDRTNHTGEQATDTITGLDAALDKVKLQSITVACSDETTALTAGAGKVTFRMPYAFTLTGVRASLTTAQAGGSILTVDINESGTTILSTNVTIDNTEKTSSTAATPPVISDTALADDAEITIDIDQIGDGTAAGLKVTLIGYQL